MTGRLAAAFCRVNVTDELHLEARIIGGSAQEAKF